MVPARALLLVLGLRGAAALGGLLLTLAGRLAARRRPPLFGHRGARDVHGGCALARDRRPQVVGDRGRAGVVAGPRVVMGAERAHPAGAVAEVPRYAAD